MKKVVAYLLLLAAVPIVLLVGTVVFQDKYAAFVSLAVILLALAALLMSMENSEMSTRKLVLIAVMTALSVAGRFLFAVVPGFKPVTAIVVLTAMYFGSQAGFLTGALTAVISNFYFGQGVWTPFQMFSWGMIGLLAGLLARPLQASRLLLALYGIFAGVLFSLLMDVWSVLWYNSGFELSGYAAAIVTALPTTLCYAASNVIFLLLLIKPISRKLGRVKTKYGL